MIPATRHLVRSGDDTRMFHNTDARIGDCASLYRYKPRFVTPFPFHSPCRAIPDCAERRIQALTLCTPPTTTRLRPSCLAW